MNSPSPASQWIEAISTLNELTQTGQLTWEVSYTNPLPPSAPRTGLIASSLAPSPPYTLAGAPFETTYETKKIRISRFSGRSSGQGLLSVSQEFIYALDILSATGLEVFRVPATSGLNDLFRSVEHQASGVEGLLSSLLSHKIHSKK